MSAYCLSSRTSGIVDMLTSRSQPRTRRKERAGGVNVRRVWMPGKNPFGWAAHTMGTVPVHWRLARKADVVHAHTFASALPAMITGRRRRSPLVLTLHTTEHERSRAHELTDARQKVIERDAAPST